MNNKTLNLSKRRFIAYHQVQQARTRKQGTKKGRTVNDLLNLISCSTDLCCSHALHFFKTVLTRRPDLKYKMENDQVCIDNML